MNTRMMFARAWEECCQCENVASTNSNSKLEIGNIGIGNNSTMATFNKMFARGVAGVVMLGLVGCDGPGLTKYYARRDVEVHFVAMEERGDVAKATDCDGYMDAALEHKMPSWRLAPPATVGDALEFFEVCALNCLCKNGHDGKGRIKVVACVGKELLERPVPSMKAEQITVRDALRRLCESVGCRFKVDSAKRTITITEKQAGDMENV